MDSDDEGPRRRLRLILLGDSKVGKTSLIRRFVYGTFDEDLDRTITIEEEEKKVCISHFCQKAF